MSAENNSPQLEDIFTIARKEWKKTKPRELTKTEEIEFAVNLINRVSSIIKTDLKRAEKADRQFSKLGKVEMELSDHTAGFFYEYFGRTENLVFGIEDEKVEVDLTHGKRGGLSDASIRYYPDLYEEHLVYKGLSAVQRANGLADRMDQLVNPNIASS